MTKNAKGGPTVISGYQLGITDYSKDLNDPGAVPLATVNCGPDDYKGISLDLLLKGRSQGGYNLQIRAKNASGFWGAWSPGILVFSP